LGYDLTDKERKDVLEQVRTDLLNADLTESAVQVKRKA